MIPGLFRTFVIWLILSVLGLLIYSPTAQAASPIDFDTVGEISELITVQYQSTAFNRRTGQLKTNVVVTNTSDEDIQCPLVLVVTSISAPGVALANASGLTAGGNPFVDLSDQIGDDEILSPGESTSPFTLIFNNPSRRRFTFDATGFAFIPLPTDSPPILMEVGNQVVDLGSTLSFTLVATDLDGDAVTFSASPLPLPENSSLDSVTGQFSFKPSDNQIGSINLIFIASDGSLTDTETVTITVQDAAPGGATVLTGQILDTNDFVQGITTPVVGATVTILGTGIKADCDMNGHFALSGIPAGNQIFNIDPSTANPAPDGSDYAGFREEIKIIAGVNNAIDRPFFIPRIDADSLTQVDPTKITVVHNPNLNITVTIPPNTAINADGTAFTGVMSISEVPEGLAPAALPEELRPGLLVTLQPVGVIFTNPVPISFGNSTDQLAPGDKANLWSLDPQSGSFVIVGIGQVSADGTVIETVTGGIRAADWIMFPPPPVQGPPEGTAGTGSENNPDNQDQPRQLFCISGSRTAVSSGNLEITHRLIGYRSLGQTRTLSLNYNSLHAAPRPVVSANTLFTPLTIVPNSVSSRFSVAGIEQGQELFTETADINRNEQFRQAVQFDATLFDTGIYRYRLELTNNYQGSSIMRVLSGEVLVNNQQNSPFGAGWTLDAISQLKKLDNGNILMTQGNGSTKLYRASALGTGNFLTEAIFETGGIGGNAVTVGDFNSDDNLDLAILHPVGLVSNPVNGLSIMTGDGSGSFSSPRVFEADPTNKNLVTSDLNRDGRLDLAVAHGSATSNNATIYLGNNNAGVVNLNDISNGFRQRHLAVADFDGDGNPDLAATNADSNDVSILLGDGFGGFNSSGSFSTVDLPIPIAAADFDEDGTPDLVVGSASFGVSAISVLLNNDVNNPGTFSIRTDYPLPGPIGGAVSSLAVGDFNNDGHVDIAAPMNISLGGSVVIFTGDGIGGFAAGKAFNTNSGTSFITAADFNGDGNLDVAALSGQLANHHVALMLGDGTCNLQPPVNFPLQSAPASIASGDFNNDGLPDIAVGPNEGINRVSILLAEASGQIGFDSPSGDFSTLVENPDGTFTRTLKDGTKINFDANGFQASVVDRNGNTTTYTYDPTGLLISITDPLRLVTTLTYNGDLLSNIIDPAGRMTTFQHDAIGNLIEITDPDNTRRIFGYDPNHRMTLQTSKRRFDTIYEYDAAGRHINSILPDDTTRQVSSSQAVALIDATTSQGTQANPAPIMRPSDAVSSFTDGNGNPITFSTDRFGAGTDSSDAIGRRSTIERDEDGNPVRIVNGNGAVSTMEYDDRGNLLTLTEAVGTSLEAQTKFEYDSVFNQVTKIIDELDHQTLFEIDPTNGNVISITRVVGQPDDTSGESDDIITFFTYTPEGLIDTVTDPLGRITNNDYDTQGRLISVTFAKDTSDEATQQFEYDSFTTAGKAGLVTASIDENGNRTQFVYDDMNRVTQVTEPDPDGTGPLQPPVTIFAYDTEGNLFTTTDARQNTTTREYDELNRLTKIIDANGIDSTFGYDDAGNLTLVIDPLGHLTQNFYDARNRLMKTIDPESGVTEFGYDDENNLTSVTDPETNQTQFVYDDRNRLTQEIDPLTHVIQFAYDDADNLISQTDRIGRIRNFVYDYLDRLTTETWKNPDTTVVNTIGLTYDDVGNLLTSTDNFSALTLTYDNRNRVKTTNNAGTPEAPNVVLNFTYDDFGNVLMVSDVINNIPGAINTAIYDPLNRMTRITQTNAPGGTGISDKRVDIGYNELGQFDSINRLSDLDAMQPVVGSAFAYNDNLNRLTDLSHSNSTGTVSSFAFKYDDASRITQITDVDGQTDYTYDKTDQLATATHTDPANPDESYTYDSNGNRANSHLHGFGYVTGPANRLESDGTFSYQYDDEGNMISRTEIVTGASRIFIYDHRNRLTNVTDEDSLGNETLNSMYIYDTLNRRITKAVDTDGRIANGGGPLGEQVTHFVYDREDVILEFIDDDGTVGPNAPTLDKRIFHGPITDQVLAEEKVGTSEGVHWLLTDHLGTTRDLMDNSGNIINHLIYDSFGNMVVQSNPNITTRYRFTGREWEPESSLYYFRARHYAPNIGRFLQGDPIRFIGGNTNIYSYVSNNPLLLVDPSGLVEIDPFGKGKIPRPGPGGSPYVVPKKPNPVPSSLDGMPLLEEPNSKTSRKIAAQANSKLIQIKRAFKIGGAFFGISVAIDVISGEQLGQAIVNNLLPAGTLGDDDQIFTEEQLEEIRRKSQEDFGDTPDQIKGLSSHEEVQQ